MKKVRVLGLPMCSWCNSLKKELQNEGIPFEFEDVEGESEIADRLEVLLSTEDYPIIIVEDASSVGYVFRASDHFGLGRHTLRDGSTKIGTFNLAGLVEGVKTLLNN